MKVIERFNVSKPPEGPRTFTFQLSGAGVASVVVVGVLCLVWVFILGVLVGRGYKPETAVPELAQMMPSAPAPAAPEQKEPPTVLKPEELQFMESLQGKKPTETVTVDSSKKSGDNPAGQPSSQTPITPPPNSSLEMTPAPLPKGQVATSSAQPDRKTVSSSESRKEKSSTQPSRDKDKKSKDSSKSKEKEKTKDKKEKDKAKDKKDKDKAKDKDKKDKDKKSKDKERDKVKDKDKDKDKSSKRYKVTYQIASVEDRKQAEREADRLTKMGLSSHVEEAKVDGKTVYRVILRVRGTDSDIKSTLGQAGAKKPIQREKKPL